MKHTIMRTHLIIYLGIFVMITGWCRIWCVDSVATTQSSAPEAQDIRAKNGGMSDRTLIFSFREEPLVDIINMVAAERGINIVMPAGADAITSKVTLHIEEPLTIAAAWDMLHTIL